MSENINLVPLGTYKLNHGGWSATIIMGLENREGGKYISIFNGKFTQRVQEGTPGAIERVNKNGKVVHEKFYDSFTAKLVNIKIGDSPYGKQWTFSFRDNGEVYHLNLGYSNGFAKQFVKMLPNIDLSKEMKISPSVKEVDGQKKSSLFVNQDGIAIKHAFTKDNPNGLPTMEEITVKGNKVWDDTKQMAFLEEMVYEKILPKLPKDTSSAPQVAENLDEFAADMKGEGDEDLGF